MKRASRKKTTKRTKRKKGRVSRKVLLDRLAALAVWGLIAFMALMAWFVYDLPSSDDVKPLQTRASITIVARDDSVIARYGGLKGEAIAVEDLPIHTTAAVLAIEDRRFYKHFGVDVFGLARAMLANAKALSFVQGGSTITQQLAKNLFLTPDKTIRRKVQEALMAIKIEQRFSKDEIFSAYLNRVYFGAGAYGIDAAARTYFNKSATELDLWESAMLAGLLKAPSRYSPFANPELAQRRAQVVIAAMEDAGYISERRSLLEKNHILTFSPERKDSSADRYFADWVIDQAQELVSVTDRDLVVKTTLDPQLQSLAVAKQRALFATIPEESQVTQTAMISLSLDGAVLAMVGGVDYSKSQFNRATQAQRQPGSAFKPFVYLAALEAGFRTHDKILDDKITEGSYRPENHDGEYLGMITLADALALSRNTATVRLLNDLGVSRLIDVARRAGVRSPLQPELALGLGVSEVNLLELTASYTAIANGGYRVAPHAILEISDRDGNIFYLRTKEGLSSAFDQRHVKALDDVLAQVVSRGTGQAARLSSVRVAGKTGTTQNYRDAWFVGYTPNLVTGIWMGNDDNSPMNRVGGGGYPARLWRAYVGEALQTVTPSAPVFVPQRTTESFRDMINRWTGGSSGPSQQPAYNR